MPSSSNALPKSKNEDETVLLHLSRMDLSCSGGVLNQLRNSLFIALVGGCLSEDEWVAHALGYE